ncbi:unnamed protein product [Miscanthus lutarioriparius]|uniref:SMARCC C-terminal domain-containing protein n=1 Tax=Miscanthus lutarioriparius TaxID=422564 RepID=A0A811NGP1_9POAL|nr:unnamed protein product [Miscanthus lutarioriparius]
MALQHGVKHTAGYVLLPLNKVRDPSEGITPVNGLLRRSRYCKFVALAREERLPSASPSVSPENVKHAAMFGLSAAAMKSKLFADQEEREVQRPAATVINHQLKRLELKLKQFAEVETLLLKECEQVERVRQRISAERVRTRQA